jgi:hypothetical protein
MPSHPHDRPSEHSGVRRTVEIAVVLLGGALLGVALLANQRWLDRHFLPSFFLTRRTYVMLETMARCAIGGLGAGLALVVRTSLARVVTQSPGRIVHVAVAAGLALGAGEFVLRHVQLRPAEWLGRDQEPRRMADARLGWRFVPSRTGHGAIGGRTVDYAFDAAGYRVRRSDEPVDPERPTILFTGESVMFGKGLTWDESIPAQVGTLLGTQSANLAVDGYGSDQAFLRVQAELPHFRRPVAVVAMFVTTLFGRNLDDDRPHLGPGLTWLPGVPHGRLRSLVQLVAPYRSDETVGRGIAVTREVFDALVGLAAARGATPLVLVLQVGPEDSVERALRRRILDAPGLPWLLVEVDPAWRVPGDVHPDARAARAIAAAVASRLTSATRQPPGRPQAITARMAGVRSSRSPS